MAISHREAFELMHQGLDAALQRGRDDLPAGRLQDAVLAALDPASRQRLETHWAGCAGCQADLALSARLRAEAAQRWPHTLEPRTRAAALAATSRPGPRLSASLVGQLLLLAAVLLGLLWALEVLRPQPAETPALTAENPVLLPPAQITPTPQTSESGWVRLTASDGEAGNLFGYWAALDGDFLAAGAPGVALADGTGGFATERPPGAVYVYQRQGEDRIEEAKLLPASSQPGDRFGLRVALSGDTLAVGAPYKQVSPGGNAAGAVYLFQRQGETWVEQALLTAPDGAPFDLFGGAIALEGDTLVVGARSADLPGVVNAGAVYVFQRESGGSDWALQARLEAEGGAVRDYFGQEVVLYEDRLLVAAPGQDDRSAGQNSGAVYIFERRGEAWRAQGTLNVPDLVPNAQFGYALSLNPVTGTLAVYAQISQPNPEFNEEMGLYMAEENYPGTVYVFEDRSGSWRYQAHLVPRYRTQGVFFFPPSGRVVVGGRVPEETLGLSLGWHGAFFFQRQGEEWVERSPEEMSLPGSETTGVFHGMPYLLDANEQVLALQELDLTEFGSTILLLDIP